MQYLFSLEDIVNRADKCGLSVQKLARQADVHASTIYRRQTENNTTRRTLEKLSKVLIAHELAMRDHLVELHGMPDSEFEVPAGVPR